MRIEISEDVLAAIVAFVELQRTPFPDDTDFLDNDLPVITAWLDGLGLLSPSGAGAEKELAANDD